MTINVRSSKRMKQEATPLIISTKGDQQEDSFCVTSSSVATKPVSHSPKGRQKQSNRKRWIYFRSMSQHWFPNAYEDREQQRLKRSYRRRIFLMLTEPETSICSAIFFSISIVAITVMNTTMIIQTMSHWQYTPTDCRFCGGTVAYGDDDSIANAFKNHPNGVPCVCPPSPVQWTVLLLDGLVRFFTVEWLVRILTFEPPRSQISFNASQIVGQWIQFLTSTNTVLDALAIFPYYIETLTSSNGLMSLRLLRLFRVFQLLRLGQYSDTFMSLSAVFFRSVPFLKLFLGVILFGAAFFGSIMYWLEKGTWQYYSPSNSYQFVRVNQYGTEEISPFTSIPAAFWWFAVTVTTVGYGDTYPTTVMGKWIAAVAMLLGVLVIAFPVSIFSDLWSKELRKTGALAALQQDTDTDNNGCSSTNQVKSLQKEDANVLSVRSNANTSDDLEHRRGDHHDVLALSRLDDDSTLLDDDHVALRKEDLTELISHIQTINESHQQIRFILRKYKLS
jgi:Ion transport protein